MSKFDSIIYIIITVCVVGLIFYSYQSFKSYIPKNNENEKEVEYISFEFKRSKVEEVIKLVDEKKYDEAFIILNRFKKENNPFVQFYTGYVLFMLGKKEDGLKEIKNAIQNSPTLYDMHYKNNLRHLMEKILVEIKHLDNFKAYRHFIESKLKGGCG